jgi:hypothetical protein
MLRLSKAKIKAEVKGGVRVFIIYYWVFIIGREGVMFRCGFHST